MSILEAAIANLTDYLDNLRRDSTGISSHEKPKEKTLSCLINLIDKAPAVEYEKFVASENYNNLLGYLLYVLCHLAKEDKSKKVRQDSLDIFLCLLARLENIHDTCKSGNKCVIRPIILGLPGVTCAFFKLIKSNTKLPKGLLVKAIKALTRYISTAFILCKHANDNQLSADFYEDVTSNLSIRINDLFDYSTVRNSDLPVEVKFELLDLCDVVIRNTRSELVKRTLISIIKYTAFIQSAGSPSGTLKHEAQLKVMLIFDTLRSKLTDCDSSCDRLDSIVISSLITVLDNLHEHWMSMLISERHSEISILTGLINLLPEATLTTVMEMAERRSQLFTLLTQLTEFSTNQPFLFLTEGKIDEKAIESCGQKIYTIEKRFSHINEDELSLIETCCSTIGQNCHWLPLTEIVKSDLRQFSSTSNLFLTHLILKGSLLKSKLPPNVTRFTQQLIEYYIDRSHEEYVDFINGLKQGESVCSEDILKIVIAIETLVTLIQVHLKFAETESDKIIILRSILCPLLNWVSSSSRAISEAALSSLTQLSQIYGKKSTKSLIEDNIDYIVDGVMETLDRFDQNDEVTNVLAFTFRLSSIDSFYYFRDVYDRVFRLSGTYCYTEKSASIALLFYRTLSILCDWMEANKESQRDVSISPLTNKESVISIINELSIKKRIKKLETDTMRMIELKQKLESPRNMEEEQCVVEEIQSGKILMDDSYEECAEKDEETDAKKRKPIDIELTEKILEHCVSLVSANHVGTKIWALKAAARGFRILRDDENTLLPLVHKMWSPLMSRLTGDYRQNLEVSLSAFECLISMAYHAKDFIQRRALDRIIPRLCLFLETQHSESKGKKNYGPYSMTIDYRCQLRILSQLGYLAYHLQLAYSNLWRVVRVVLLYLDQSQISTLRDAARESALYLIAADADCVWFYAKKSGLLKELPFELIYLVEEDT